MKVEKSSKECAEFNANPNNQGAIAAGLMEAWEPSDRILAGEKIQAEREAAGFKLAQDAKAVLTMIGAVGGERRGKVGDVDVEIDDVRASTRSYYSSSVSGWRLYIGDRYGSQKGSWVGIGDGATLGINTKQLVKAQAKIKEEQDRIDAKKAAAAVKQNVQQRTEAFIKDNAEFCKLVGHTTYDSGETYYYGSGCDRRASYHTAFLVNEDGSVKIGGETFTVSQWVEIFTLRTAQAEAMKALKESFKVQQAVAA